MIETDTYLSFVAMDMQWIVGRLEDDFECLGDLIVIHPDFALVGWNVDLNVSDALAGHELKIFGFSGTSHQSSTTAMLECMIQEESVCHAFSGTPIRLQNLQDRSYSEAFQKWVVIRPRISAAEDTAVQNGAKVWGRGVLNQSGRTSLRISFPTINLLVAWWDYSHCYEPLA
jgi:hypothetical protein